MAQISRVIVADFRRYAEVGTKEGRAKFRNEFLTRITLIAETLRLKAAVKAVLGLRPVRLMPISA